MTPRRPDTDQGRSPSPTPHPEVRARVKDLLLQSAAFRALPADQQKQIARHTVEVCDYLARPEGIEGHRLGNGAPSSGKGDPYALGLAGDTPSAMTGKPGGGGFTALGAQEGARIAGALLQQVSFPTFVSGLIEGVFHAIVKSSIEQMQAYGELVANVAKTLNQFRDENVTENQGRDYLVQQFPEMFHLDIDTGAEGGPAPRVRLRDGVDEEAALKKVNSLPIDGGPLTSLDDDSIEEKAVPAARTQLAASRQQLLATMVLMGINRIVVTDGRISAKVLYDFQARDTMHRQTSATWFDYGDQYAYTSEGDVESSSAGGERTYSRGEKGSYEEDTKDASYYTKGKYKNTASPVLTLASAMQETTDASLSTKASLAGMVEVNFKSDYLPLEKMADSFQIARLQEAARPGPVRATGAPVSAPAAEAPAPSPPAGPATAPAPAAKT
jgi:hypothetical protein